jgi:serine/threonine protein kinase
VNKTIVGAYELGALLGVGTVGEVYRARHRDTGAPAVVKFLQGKTAREPEIQQRFVREVAIAEQLDHPNIVRHYDCGLHEDRIFFAMELVDGGTLKDVLSVRGRLPWREVAECAVQVCDALAYAHQRGVIHRDLKPANLFLSAGGHVKVGDFGLARDLNRSRLTLEGQTVGTCRYMPPEQITGEAEPTGGTDLYALGCILYQALTGRPPFDGASVIEVFEAHLYSDAVPLCDLVPDCPRDLADLVMRLLAKEPVERPADAAAVKSELEAILAGAQRKKSPSRSQTSTTGTNAAVRVETPSLTARLYAATPTPAPIWKKWLLIAGILITLAVAFAVALVLWR